MVNIRWVEIPTHTMLKSINQTEVETSPYIQIEIGHKLVFQIFESIFAHYTNVFLLILIHETISHASLLEESLRGNKLAQIEVGRCFDANGINITKVDALPKRRSLCVESSVVCPVN